MYTGQLVGPLSDNFETAWTVTKTSKFPGRAVTIPGCATRVTPEVFPSSSKFIVPGVTTAASLKLALDHLHKLQTCKE